jgi:predicted dehydrogenase
MRDKRSQNVKLRAGFIGFGRMGITHFSILNNHPDVDVVAICDESSTLLDALKKYLTAKSYSDYKKMIANEKLDFVVISTPTESHAEIIKVAIDNNIHVFSEKPFCLNADEGEKILNYLSEKPVVNQVGYVNRFNEVFVEVKKLLQAGLLGDIKNFSSEMYGATVLKDSKSGWRSTKKMGGGCLYEMASHCIDLAVYLFGKPDKVAGSIMQNIYSSEVEDLVSSTLLYDKGYCGTIHVNWSDASYRKPTNIVKVFGTKGRIVADKHAYKVFLRDPAPEHGFNEGWNTRYITEFAESVRFYVRGNEFTRQLDYFVECVGKKQFDSTASFAEALKTDAVMEEITRDAVRTLDGVANFVPSQSDRKRSSSFLRNILK